MLSKWNEKHKEKLGDWREFLVNANGRLHEYDKPIEAIKVKDCAPCKKKYSGHDMVINKSGGVEWTAKEEK